jgi:hypothetical protein
MRPPTILQVSRRLTASRHPSVTGGGSIPGPAPSRMTPLASVRRGLLAGASGTAAMDLLWFCRYKRHRGRNGLLAWEFSSDLSTWEQAPAPAQIGRRLFEALFARDLPATQAALVNNATHWGYGILTGVPYGIVAGSAAHSRVGYGVPFGATVWATSYVVLPLAKLYQPIWAYDRRTLGRDLSAHLVYGQATAAVFELLSRPARATES